MDPTGPGRRKTVLSGREVYDGVLNGEIETPLIPSLPTDPPPHHISTRTLAQFRQEEGRSLRKQRLQALWHHICKQGYRFPRCAPADQPSASVSQEQAEQLRIAYESELYDHVGSHTSGSAAHRITWPEFKAYAEAKEEELWGVFHELDVNSDGHINNAELDVALRRAGITLTPSTLDEFMNYLTTSPHSHTITFSEFRDFLLLLPRKASPAEIYKYYQMKKYLGDDGRGVARVTMEGDVSLSAEDRPPTIQAHKPLSATTLEPKTENTQTQTFDDDEEEEEDEHHVSHPAFKFLLAGGIAGAVSRTFTAPFDRLKIFLITRPPDIPMSSTPTAFGGARVLGSAIARLYAEGGVLGFWTGNGLSVAKIFPESAIKFFSYESAKRGFAKYYDGVEDTRDISGISRFLSGGIGGITSQLSIYPVETLKTQMMSNTGEQRLSLVNAAKHLWVLGGMRAYYRGLTIGLVGVFPYSAIDMSTFEALKLAYLRSTGKEEPGVMALLAFGSISGSVGATSVFPLNLVRTRLQASGSPGHPQRYTGVWDVASKTWANEGWTGFYRGLFPTLAKVVPAVSISYVVYEHSKRRLGI